MLMPVTVLCLLYVNIESGTGLGCTIWFTVICVNIPPLEARCAATLFFLFVKPINLRKNGGTYIKRKLCLRFASTVPVFTSIKRRTVCAIIACLFTRSMGGYVFQ